jgi:hypothetical protein
VTVVPNPNQTQIVIGLDNALWVGGSALIGGLVVTAYVILKWLARQKLNHLREEWARLANRVELTETNTAAKNRQIEERIDHLEKMLPRIYTPQEDFVRQSTLVDAKLDAVHRRLDQMMVVLMEVKK